jgi:hypothetical protein
MGIELAVTVAWLFCIAGGFFGVGSCSVQAPFNLGRRAGAGSSQPTQRQRPGMVCTSDFRWLVKSKRRLIVRQKDPGGVAMWKTYKTLFHGACDLSSWGEN